MQHNSAELFLKAMKMRELVGDGIATSTLEGFLKATKGDLEAAVVLPHKTVVVADDNEEEKENKSLLSNIDVKPISSSLQNNTNNTKKKDEIEQLYEILSHQLSIPEIERIYEYSNNDMNIALDRCFQNIEQQNNNNNTTSTTTTSTNINSIDLLDDSNDNGEYNNNNYNENNNNNNNGDIINLTDSIDEIEVSSAPFSSYSISEFEEEDNNYNTNNKKIKRENSGMDNEERFQRNNNYNNNNNSEKKRRIERIDSDNEGEDENEKARINSDVMEIYEAIDRMLAPSMIAETYEKCERDKTTTLARCYDYAKQVKRDKNNKNNKNNRENRENSGTVFSPVDLDDIPVSKKLDFSEQKRKPNAVWPKSLGTFLSTVILMGCGPLPENTPVYFFKSNFADTTSIHACANLDSSTMIGSLVADHARMIAPLLGEKIRLRAVSLGSSLNPYSVGANLEMPVFIEVFVTHMNLVGEYDYKEALGIHHKKKKKDKTRPLGALIHHFFTNNPNNTTNIHSKQVGDEENFNMEDLGNILGDNDTKLPQAEPHQCLTVPLRDYQKQGLWWLLQREREEGRSENPMWEKHQFDNKEIFYYNSSTDRITLDTPAKTVLPKGGLLCDDMGLGKTIQSISLIVTNPRPADFNNKTNEKEKEKEDEVITNVSKSTLILCPVSLVTQWKSEIDKFVKRGNVRTFVYYGKDRDISAKQLETYDIVITSHSIVATEFFSSLSGEEKKKGAEVTPRSLQKAKSNSTLHKVKWWRVIVDEAHVMRTKSTNIAKAIHYLYSENRWCLTGTPIQNKLEDLYSLMRFLRVEPLQSFSWWQEHIEKPCLKGNQQAVDLLKTFLAPLLLRRIKSGRITEALNLPARRVDVVAIEFNDKEKQIYQALFANSKAKFKELMRAGSVMKNYANVLLMLLRLRQCCDHLKLVEEEFGDQQNAMIAQNATNTYAYASQDSKYACAGAGNASASASQDAMTQQRCELCCDILEDATLAPCCKKCFCRECILVGLLSMKEYDHSPTKCPSCGELLSESQLVSVKVGIAKQEPIDVEEHHRIANFGMSSKIQVLITELKKVHHQKTVVFSQWTKMINLVEDALTENGMKNSFVRFDGSMNLQIRDRALKDFQNNPRYKIMLISLKAGGVGLNLTHANNVFLLDPWWNPASEDQAIDRVHRIGQTQDVVVKRLIMKSSIEEQILELQRNKIELVQTTIGNKAATGKPIGDFKLRLEDLQKLFGEGN